MTTGGTDPNNLGARSANVRIERYVPQSSVLPRCTAVVCHAGFSTLIGAFTHGLPALCLPLAADHPINAQRCAEAGAGLNRANALAIDARGPVVDPDTLHPNDVASALSRLLDDPTFTSAARRIAGEIRGMPEPAEAARFLGRVVGAPTRDEGEGVPERPHPRSSQPLRRPRSGRLLSGGSDRAPRVDRRDRLVARAVARSAGSET